MCPECGAVRGRCIQTGYDSEDRFIRLRQCQTCDHQYATVELPVPGSFYRLADSWRLKQLYAARLRRGYRYKKMGTYKRPRPRLVIDVRLVGEA